MDRIGRRGLAGIVGFVATYAALVWLGAFLAGIGQYTVLGWWPATGFALGVLARTRRSLWPVLMGPVFVLAFPLHLYEGLGWFPALLWTLGDTFEPAVGALVLVRALGLRHGEPTLSRTREVVIFAAIALGVPLVGVAITGLVPLVAPSQVPPMWSPIGWWAGDAVGILTTTPVVLTWPSPVRLRMPPARVLEAALLSAALLACVAIFLGATVAPTRLILALSVTGFPLLAWAALRFGPSGAARAGWVLGLLVSWASSMGRGLLTSLPSAQQRVLLVQAFFGLASFSALLLAATSSQARIHEKRRLESAATLDAIVRNAPVGIGYYDADLRFVLLNEALARMNGASIEAHLGRSIREMIPELAIVIEPRMRRALETGETVEDLEFSGTTPGSMGRRSWRASYFPVRLAGGEVIGLGAVVSDVTAQKEADAERERLLRELREAVHARDAFLSLASHELKTPLTPLTTRLQLLHRKALAGEPIPPELVEKTRASLGKLSFLINDLLDASRLEEATLSPKRETLELRELVRSAVAPFSLGGAHPLELGVPEEPLFVHGDRVRLAQVVASLVDNAVKFSPRGGPVEVELAERGEEAVLRVSDRGIGIPADQQSQLFQRYFKARNASLDAFGGLGLGLYIARDIVEDHGGRIWVESRQGGGSTFFVALPRLRAVAEAPASGPLLH